LFYPFSRFQALSKTNNQLQKGASVMAERKQGSVKWFNSTKGFGFIQQASGEDVFVHFKSIIGDGYKSLEENDKVEFSVTQGAKGLQASDVKLIS
jgi:CspA family cold shock protein